MSDSFSLNGGDRSASRIASKPTQIVGLSSSARLPPSSPRSADVPERPATSLKGAPPVAATPPPRASNSTLFTRSLNKRPANQSMSSPMTNAAGSSSRLGGDGYATPTPQRSRLANATPSSKGLVDHDAHDRYLREGVLAPGTSSGKDGPSSAGGPLAVALRSVSPAAAKVGSVIPASPRQQQQQNVGMMEGWRSYVLDLEAALRALPLMSSASSVGGAVDGTASATTTASLRHQTPTAERIKKVFNLFESFTRASPNIAAVLRLFRTEFAKAIFEPLGQGGGVEGGSLQSFLYGKSGDDDDAEADGGKVDDSDDTASTARDASGVDRKTASLKVNDELLRMLGTPYFDMVATLRREKAILATELDVIEAESSVEDLKKQVLKLQSLIPFYEHEINRLTTDVQRVDEELRRTKLNADVTSQQHQNAYSALDEDFQRLTRENRELLLEVQRLRKTEDAFGAKGASTAYNQMKTAKIDTLQHMFERGNQEATLLLLAHQLESSLNTVLTDADRQYHRCSEAEVHSIRAKLVRDTALLLEEMHAVEEQRSTLLVVVNSAASSSQSPPSSSSAAANGNGLAVVRETAPAKMAARIGPQAALGAVESGNVQTSASAVISAGAVTEGFGDAAGAPQGGNTESAGTATNADAKAAWVAGAFASLAPTNVYNQPLVAGPLSSSALHNVFNTAHVDPSLVFSKRVTAPLADVSSTKFLSGIEVHAAQAPGDAEYVQSIPYLDPTHTVELPLRTTHVKIKFMQPMRRDVRVKYGQHLIDPKGFRRYKNAGGGGGGGEGAARGVNPNEAAIPKPAFIQGNIADRSEVMTWLSEQLVEGAGRPNANNNHRATNNAASAMEKSMSSTLAVDGKGALSVPISQRPHASSAMEGPHWAAYREVFGAYRPFLPRLIPIEYLDFIMLRAFRLLMRKVVARYDYCLDTAVGKTSSIQTAKMYAERLFRELYDPKDLQLALLEVIESLYAFPEQIAKVYCEVLASLEVHSTAGSHTAIYLQCVAGTLPPAEGHLMAHMMHSITLCWPGTSLSTDEPLDDREVPMFLKLVYSSEGGVFTLALDGLVTDLIVGTNRNLTRNSIREYFANGIEEQQEHMLAAQADLLARKSIAIQWAELDFEDFTDVNHDKISDVASSQYPRFLYACCVLNKAVRIPPREVAYIAVLAQREQR